LTSRVVKGLTEYNKPGYRDSAIYDKKFIKILLVAINGIGKVQKKEIDKFAIEFIKSKLFFV